MSLLLNEDFSIYQLRLAYLQHIHDGVGERLINLNSSVLNNPAFRAAGWHPDVSATKRSYSPPIPTTGDGLSNEYFQAPRKNTRVSLDDAGRTGRGDDGRGGMLTSERASEDTIGAGGISAHEKKRRRRKEHMDEEDSSDLSDDSEEEDKSAAHGIKFSKMPVRRRSRSSPDDATKAELKRPGPELMITSPSRPPDTAGPGFRRGSLGQVEAIKQRARRDTTTSSEMSSENEVDPSSNFSRRPNRRAGGKKTVMMADRIQEEEHRGEDGEVEGGDSDLEDEDVGEASDLSDEFDDLGGATGESPQLLGVGVGGASEEVSPVRPPPDVPPAVTPNQQSPRKQGSKDLLPKLSKLPPGRPMSIAAPKSLLTMGLQGKSGGGGTKAFQNFADLSGKGEASPLWIKIYAPFSESPTKAIEVPLRRTKEGNPVTVAELIGLALWRYNEEESRPSLEPQDTTINRWTLRIVEDEEVDFDFPALGRTRPVTDFTSNNNRPPQRRARDKPWDEFGLVKATEEQFRENEDLTPQIGQDAGISVPSAAATPKLEGLRPPPAERADSQATTTTMHSARSVQSAFNPSGNPITGPTFNPAKALLRKETGNLLDLPQRENPQSTPRTGASKTVTVHFTDAQTFATSNLNIPTTSDTYIAELFNHSYEKLGLDKALYVLKVHGTQTVAPSDRTVEALGSRLHLDLVRRRFMGAGAAGDGMFGLGLSGSPGSSSPNAPLELTGAGTPTTTTTGAKKRKPFGLHTNGSKADTTPTLNQASSMMNLAGQPTVLTAGAGLDVVGKKYSVLRKQPLSFAASHPRTLIITPEYMQILPAAPDSLAPPTGKVTNVPMGSIVGVKVSRKHPKMVRVLVFKEKETKRYDFECGNKEEAADIVADVRRGIMAFRDDGGAGGI